MKGMNEALGQLRSGAFLFKPVSFIYHKNG
jgi:hypothetical protein